MKKTKWLAYLTFAVTIVYVIWRIFFTLPFSYGFLPLFFGCLLLISELIGFLETYQIYVGSYVEPERPSMKEDDYPDVDVFIATYNEPADLLRKTIHGCLSMDYPDKNKVHIYICDDGSREEIESLAKHMKVGYLKREEHKHAKAGNYNHALEYTSSPLVATFDADMIPMSDFLISLVPYFFLPFYEKVDGVWRKKDQVSEEEINEQKVGFVQSPQSFYNADLFQYNLYSEGKVPNEQNFFFRQVQLTRNANNTAIYGGSNTILSRQALLEVGGFYTESITEDLATGLLIQSKGYRCYAISEVHANGLSPTEIDSLCKQRERWARGCIQTFRRLKVHKLKGLTRKQKRSYFYSVLYWYSPLRRGMFILAPILYTVFHIRILDSGFLELVIFWLPQLLLYNGLLKKMNGEIRTSRLSNLYDTIMFPYLIPTVILETFGISNNVFHVTNKDRKNVASDSQKRFTRRYFIIFLFLLGLTMVGVIRCLKNIIFLGQIGYLILLFWLIVNGYYVLMSIYFMLGRKVNRESERIQIREKITIKTKDQEIDEMSLDISESGCAVLCDFPYNISPSDIHTLIISYGGQNCYLKAKVVHVKKEKEGYRFAFSFEDVSEENLYSLYTLLYDRIPPMPTTVSKKSSFFEDLQSNINHRKRKEIYSNRKLPRISMNEDFLTTTGNILKVTSFNYEYLVITNPNIEVRDDLVIFHKSYPELLFQIEFIRSYSKGHEELHLFYILNNKDLGKSPKLHLLIKSLYENQIIESERIISIQKKKEEYFQEIDFI